MVCHLLEIWSNSTFVIIIIIANFCFILGAAKRLFRTGDFGKIADVGAGSRLYYEGRTDMIMRVRGREIELNDIVRAVNSTGICKECAVLCYHRNREDQTAVAFCVLKDERTTLELTAALSKVLEDILIPDIYVVPHSKLPYLPSGKLDRLKLVKMYKYRRMECNPEDWQALNLAIAEKQAAKVLFEAISHSTGLALRFVMQHYQSSFWDIGGNSLNALMILHACRENGYLISIDQFVVAENIAAMIKFMVDSSHHPVTDAQMTSSICELADLNYTLHPLVNENKDEVIRLLSKGYGSKCAVSTLIGATAKDHAAVLECFWDEVVKQKLSVVVKHCRTEELVGATLCLDINGRHFMKRLKRVGKPVSYVLEALQACEDVVRRTTVNKDKGKVIQIFLLATSESVESKINIILVEFMLKGIMRGALLRGFSWALVMSTTSLIRDLCGTMLQYDLIAEIRMNRFVARDKTKPFRFAGDYMYYRAYYKLFA